jgi:glycogen synthase
MPAPVQQTVRKHATPLEQKAAAKAALQRKLGWPEEPKCPLVCLPAGMTDALGGALFKEVMPGMLSLQMGLLVLGRGTASYGTLFTGLAEEQGHRVHIVPDKDESIADMYAAADMALFLSTELPTRELSLCLMNGVVPVSPSHVHLHDYNPVQETGNAFLFDGLTKWLCFAALVRAAETFKFPFDWRTIQKHCIESAKHK